MDITFRKAIAADKPRILTIAAQVWEGEDYIPDVIDAWLQPDAPPLLAACVDDELIGFARYARLFPSYAWFEGLRVDPAWQGRGVARALMEHLLERARLDGVRRVGASTYVDNFASQHLMETHGFTRAASFVYCEASATELRDEATGSEAGVISIPPDEALAFIQRSRFLQVSRGFFPHSWRFYPFALGPETILREMRYLLGIRRDGELAALLCAGKSAHGPRSFSVDFLDGNPDAMKALARHAVRLAGSEAQLEAMTPRGGDTATPSLVILRDLGMNVWNEGREDVFVYERALA